MASNIILAIDPGPEISGVVRFDADKHRLIDSSEQDTKFLLKRLSEDRTFTTVDHFVCEDIVSYGKEVGKSTFDTCKIIGRLQHMVEARGKEFTLINRRDVKTVLAGGATYPSPTTGARKKVDDAVISAIIRSRFPETGGGSRPAVGTKKQPGPLYGLKGHAWQALAVALTFREIVLNLN